MTRATCPNPNCPDGEDSMYMVDDQIHFKCDDCGTTWTSIDPSNRLSFCTDIKIGEALPCKVFKGG